MFRPSSEEADRRELEEIGRRIAQQNPQPPAYQGSGNTSNTSPAATVFLLLVIVGSYVLYSFLGNNQGANPPAEGPMPHPGILPGETSSVPTGAESITVFREFSKKYPEEFQRISAAANNSSFSNNQVWNTAYFTIVPLGEVISDPVFQRMNNILVRSTGSPEAEAQFRTNLKKISGER